MNTIKINKGSAFMVAHRGVSGLEPENSIPAFIAAGNRSYYGVETDVHATADGKFVVIHDSQTARVAGDDICIEQSSYDLVRKIRLQNLSGLQRAAGMTAEDVACRPDLIIPSLAEYISICKKYEKKCVLELKGAFASEVIVKMVEEIRSLDYLDGVVFISFNFDNMVCLRYLLPEQEMQILTSRYDEEVLGWLNQYNWDIDIRYTAITKEAVDEIHENGHKVNCWTVDDKDLAETLVEWGVDFITSNILE